MDIQKVSFQTVKVENDENIGEKITKPNTEKRSSEFNEKQILYEYFVPDSIKQEEIDIKSEEEEEGDQFSTNEFSEKQVQGNYYDSQLIKQKDIEIKTEKEGGGKFSKELSAVEVEKGFHPISEAAPLNNLSRINTNNCPANIEPPVLKCNYQRHKKKYIKRRVLSHMPQAFKCTVCPYKSNKKQSLDRHLLVHIPKEEAELHKCPQCRFISKWKCALTNHLLIHKNPDEITWYKCPQCLFTSKWRGDITKHLLVHRKADEITWYYCPQCPFKTKRKSSLVNGHMIIHKKDQPTYKCTSCSYESPRKYELKRHLKNMHGPIQPDEISWYRHALVHKSDRPNIFKCSKCPFETRYSNAFAAHKLQHEDRDKWLSCSLCPFKTTYTSSLTKHALVHKKESEIEWFRCSECSFKAKRKQALSWHKQKHSPDRFYCYLCLFKTCYKHQLVIHIRTKHRDAEGRIRRYL